MAHQRVRDRTTSFAFSAAIVWAPALWAAVMVAGCGDSAPSPVDAGGGCAADPAVCETSNAVCGVLRPANGPCVSCGVCTFPLLCGGAGVPNQCGCTTNSCESEGAQCGEIDDGCGNRLSCGTCQAQEVCLDKTCQPVIPVGLDCSFASGGCEAGAACCLVGTGTLCVESPGGGICPGELPDLQVRESSTRGSIAFVSQNFEANHCALGDGCLGAPGNRNLIVFGTFIENVGRAAFQLGTPRDDPAFQFDACSTHDHYHYRDFMTYSLHTLNQDGSTGPMIVENKKDSHCLEDGTGLGTPGSPALGSFTCGDATGQQGLSQGWGYTYERDVDCQWLDVTDVAAGDYIMRIFIDPTNKWPEEREDNNLREFFVTVP